MPADVAEPLNCICEITDLRAVVLEQTLGGVKQAETGGGIAPDRSAELERFADKIKPQLLILSAGFDCHRADPIGSLGLETEDFGELTRIVLDVAAGHPGGRMVSVLEGGYNPDAMRDCIALHLEGLLARDQRASNGSNASIRQPPEQ